MHKDPHIANIFSAEEEDCLRLDQMAAYLEGKLEGHEKNAIERHLINCELCALTFESISEHSAAEITKGAAAISEAAWERSAALEKKKRRGAIFWLSAAASVALLISVGFFTMRGPSKEDFDKAFSEAINGTVPPSAEDSEGDYAMDRPNKDAETKKIDALGNLRSKNASKSGVNEDLSTNREVLEDAKINRNENKELKSTIPLQEQGVFEATKTPAPEKAPIASYPTVTNSKNSAKESIQMSSPTMGKDAVKGGIINQSKDRISVAEEESASDFDDFAATESDELVMEKPVPAAPKAVDTKYVGQVSGKSEIGTSKKNGPGKSKEAAIQQDQVRETQSVAPSRSFDKGDNLASTTVPVADSISTGQSQTLNDGLLAYQEGRYRDAASDFRKSTEKSPSNLQAHLLAADSYLRISQPQAALFHIERVLAQPGNSYYAEAEWYKALALIQMHDGKKAKKQLQIVIDRNGKYKAQAQKALDEL